jgi:methanogenic corrinoid protein MtbC1
MSTLEPVCERYLEAALAGDRRLALALALDALALCPSPVELYERLFTRAQHELGRRWQDNRISVAHEHLASAVTQWVLVHLHARLPVAPGPLGKVVLFAVEGELHQLGLTLVADVLELDGWSVVLVGANTPTQAAVRAIEEHRPRAVGLGATMPASRAPTLEAVAALRVRWPSLPLVLGGRALVGDEATCLAAGALGVSGSLASARALFAGLPLPG